MKHSAKARAPWPMLPSRRGFLIGGGIGLGLLVGYALWPRSFPNVFPAGEGDVLLGPWIRVGTNGRVTVAVPQTEMGQGVYSAFAAIVADELGAAWTQMAVEPAPWYPTYANVGLAHEATAGLPSFVRGLAAGIGEDMLRRFNVHLTAGSNSVRSYEPVLRLAAAEARARLVAVAARRWGVAAAHLDTAAGFIVYKANRMAFAEAAGEVDPAAEPPAPRLRADPPARRERPRLDLPPKVDGSARFGTDIRLPDMVYAAIRHGPALGHLVDASAPDGIVLVKGPNWVATTGITSFEAQRALEQVEAEFATDERAAGPWMAEELRRAARGSDGGTVHREGNVDAAFSAARSVVEASYELPFLAHVTMEPMVATARELGGRLEIWGPTQSLSVAHWQVGRALAVDDDSLVIHPTLAGGGMGRKIENDAMVEAALIARATGKPVQLMWSREEDIGSDCFRPAAAARLRAVLADKGSDAALRAIEARVATPALGASFLGRTLPRLAPSPRKASASDIEGLDRIPYQADSFRAVHVPVDLPVPVGYWRSVAHSFSCFVLESFIDELAAAAGADPLAFRLARLTGKPRHQNVLRALADAARWDEAPAAGMARGMALSDAFGSIAAMAVTAGIVDRRPRITAITSVIDCGRVVSADGVRQQLEGAAIMGLSAALHEEVTFEEGEAVERNFDRYHLAGLADFPPTIETLVLDSGDPSGGVGEAGLPPAAPALANALFRATGRRVRTLPLGKAWSA